MEFKYFTICGICPATFVLPFIIGQTLTGETLKQESFCDLNNVNLSCSSDSIIALENVQLGYNFTRCSQACCSFSIHDCIVPLTDIQTVKRSCSGQSTCLLRISGDADFCSFGRNQPSYLYFEYFCIPKSRVASVCSNTTRVSLAGEPLYLTNEGFPGVTAGDASCSCSFEAESCSSSTASFVIDADLYFNTTSCIQQITFTDSNSSYLGNVGCESYYNAYIVQKLSKTNYIQIDFINNSTQNREGIFFIGFKATEPNITLNISCPAAQPTWCIECGTPDQPINGKVILDDPTYTGYHATASVTCNLGFNASATTITCKEKGIWEEVICNPIDCVPLPAIENGSIQLDVPDNKSFGASATVTCDSGYTANTTRVSCTETGTWEVAACLINCGTPDQPTNGMVMLDDPSNTGYNATASVTCNPGFNASATSITCKEKGIWEEVMCNPIDCVPLPTIENGNIQLDVPDNKSFGASATVTCASGYVANTTRVSCTETGTWEAAACLITNCTDEEWQCISGPSQCINISKQCDNNTDCLDNSDEFNCTGTEICNDGQALCRFPNGSHICKPGGEVCDCGTPSIVNGNVTLPQPGNTSSGATATLVCNNGYNASAPTVTCESDGLWTIAYCTPKDCGNLPGLSMGSFTLTSAGETTFGATATVTCLTGYVSSKAIIACLENASWDTATCNIKDCGKPPAIEHGKIELAVNNATTYGATAKVLCDNEYYTEKAVVRCTDQSKWESVTCVINETMVLPPPEDGNSVIVIATVVPICGLAVLQLMFSIVLHRKIYQKYTEPGDKIANIVLLSAVPILGIFIIASRWKALQYRKYIVLHPEHLEDDRQHKYLTTGNGRPISDGSDTKGYTNPTVFDGRPSGYMAKQKSSYTEKHFYQLERLELY